MMKWDETFDVICVGYGFAGAVAAVTAHDTGARVLLLEKMPDPGGISICSAGGVRISRDADASFESLKTILYSAFSAFVHLFLQLFVRPCGSFFSFK